MSCKELSQVKVAILDDYQGVASQMADWSQLPQGTELQFFQDHLADEDRLVERLKDFQVIMGMRERTPFPRSLLERLPQLRLLITTGGRNASFDVAAATELGIVVSGTGGSGEGPTELTWGLIIGLLRQIPQEDQLTRQGKWGATVGIGLKDKTIGLLGLGHIGSRVARVANAFDMNVIAWSQNLTAQRARECQATLVDKDTLFRDSDIVSIHVRLSDRTRGLVGARELGLMKPTAYLINISRGPIVDEAALIDVLRRKAIAGAGIDTFDIEPLPSDHPILKLSNTVLTPHIGYVTEEGYRAFYSGVVEDIRAFVSGEPIRVVNPGVLESPQLRGTRDLA
jgi:phosphoglycerate dehydrogenase-like enzyme